MIAVAVLSTLAAAKATAARLHGAGNVHGQCPAINLLSMQSLNGGLGLRRRAHLDEPEALGTAESRSIITFADATWPKFVNCWCRVSSRIE